MTLSPPAPGTDASRSPSIGSRWAGHGLRALIALVACAVAFAGGFYLTPSTEATDVGYRFQRAGVSIYNYTSSYGTYASSAASDYSSNTDLSVSYGFAPAELYMYQGNYGATPWLAGARPYHNGSNPCADYWSGTLTGNCNKTTKKAYYGYIYWNDYYGTFPTGQRHKAVRHEIGHIFGLGHVGCSTTSVMNSPPDCGGSPSSLASYEIGLLNSWY